MSEDRKLILIGGGGHCKSVIDVCISAGKSIDGVLDPFLEVGSDILGVPILGGDEDISKYALSNDFLISIGFIKDNSLRKKISEILKDKKANLISVVSSNAYVSSFATIGQGTIIMHKTSINAAVVIGENCIINTGANIEHDCIIGDFTHISTGTYVNGNCIVGKEVFIGSGSVVKQGITICDNVTVGANSYVNRDIDEPGIYVGSPIKKINNG